MPESENGHHDMDAEGLLEASLQSDAELLGMFYRALKGQGIPAVAAGVIVSDFYSRMRDVIAGERE